MRILLCQDMHETKARPMTPVAILDLASYYRSLGHEVYCRSTDEATGGRFDIIGLSALSPTPDSLLANFTRLRPLCDRLVLGGKVTTRLRDTERKLIEEIAEIHYGPGETLFGNQYTLDGYPAWSMDDLKAMRICDGSLMSSRGCPYHCNFCNNTEDQVRRFPPARTARNIAILKRYGYHQFHFLDDVFGLSVSYGRDIKKAIDDIGESIDGKVRFFIHVRHVKTAIALIGLFHPCRVSIGIESGCDATLDSMNKGFTAEEALLAVKTIYDETHVCLYTMFILGYPGESLTQLRETLDLIKTMHPYVAHCHASFYQPVVGTVGYDMAMSRNPNMQDGGSNAEISWLDPLLRKHDLLAVKHEIELLNRQSANVLD